MQIREIIESYGFVNVKESTYGACCGGGTSCLYSREANGVKEVIKLREKKYSTEIESWNYNNEIYRHLEINDTNTFSGYYDFIHQEQKSA